jgi:signal peptidase I
MNTSCDPNRILPLAWGRNRLHACRGLLILAGGVITLLLVFRAHFVTCIAKGESMLPALHSGDLLLVDKRAYAAEPPMRGDIVVARERNDLIVKRVVGRPGEEVEVRKGILYVNQRPLAETYPVEPGWLTLRKGGLLEKKYALLGDNRSVSGAVFVHAVVSQDQIVGKVVCAVRLGRGWLGPGFSQGTCP